MAACANCKKLSGRDNPPSQRDESDLYRDLAAADTSILDHRIELEATHRIEVVSNTE